MVIIVTCGATIDRPCPLIGGLPLRSSLASSVMTSLPLHLCSIPFSGTAGPLPEPPSGLVDGAMDDDSTKLFEFQIIPWS